MKCLRFINRYILDDVSICDCCHHPAHRFDYVMSTSCKSSPWANWLLPFWSKLCIVLGGGETPGNNIDPLADMAPKFSSRNSCKLRITSRSRFLLCRMRRTCRSTKNPATTARVTKATDPATAPADRSDSDELSRSSMLPIVSAVLRNSQCGPSNKGGQSHEKSLKTTRKE